MRIRLLSALLFVCIATYSQNPDWANKSAKAVISVTTFGNDGTMKGKCYGCFIDETGTAIAPFAPFKGASRAIVVDGAGKEYDVEYMLGANEMYDVTKFRVKGAKKINALSSAATTATVGTKAWLLPYSTKKPTCEQTSITKIEKVIDDCQYYTFSLSTTDEQAGLPMLTDDGRLLGLLQPSMKKGDGKSYAVSAMMADSLKITGLSINDKTLNSTQIAKDLPDRAEEALVSLYLSQGTKDQTTRNRLIDRYIEKFPQSSNGYYFKAQTLTRNAQFDDARRLMETGIKSADDKAEAHYNYCQLIYEKEIGMADKPYSDWSLDLALQEAEQAYAITPMPIYLQGQASVLFAQKKYEEAYRRYMQLADTKLRSPENFFAAARCKEMLGDTTATLSLLDSTIACYERPYLKEVAPYLLYRAQTLVADKQYRKAVADYNDYEALMSTSVNDRFYYLRALAETEGKLYQQALDDYAKAIEMNPQSDLYHAELAALQYRFGMYDECEQNARKCIELAPDGSDGYLFLGLAQSKKGKREEGMQNLLKAKELGDTQVDDIIKKLN